MASVTDKLKELGVQVGTSQIKAPSRKDTAAASLIDVIPGSWETNPRGECFVVRKQFPLGLKHGKIKLNGPPDLSFFERLEKLEGISDLVPEEILFIDTETTGLSGGAGTYVFLIGIAKFEGDNLHFAQFFLQDPSLESSQLSALEEFISQSKLIVSYNGKSFDLPRIKTRYRFHGWPEPFADIYHVDLLHIARRLWKAHLPGCSLGDLEHYLLGLKRESIDIPGWEVSEHFYEYLRSGDPTPLESVFYHNEVDVISLAALLDYMVDRLSSPLRKKYLKEPDLLSIGRYFFSLGLIEDSIKVLRKALLISELDDKLFLEGKLSLAAAYKKVGDFNSAASLWKECTEYSSIPAMIELAKYAEHKLSDFDEGIHWTLTAREFIHLLPVEKQIQTTNQLDHRLTRLKKKAKR
jgi:uncharacterized protein YprB with RNaseH-like and TPR domain